jgi:hypothetical protein
VWFSERGSESSRVRRPGRGRRSARHRRRADHLLRSRRRELVDVGLEPRSVRLAIDDDINCSSPYFPGPRLAGSATKGSPVPRAAFVMGDRDDLYGVLGAALVDDGVRKTGHDVVVHRAMRWEALDQRPSIRGVGYDVEGPADVVQEAVADVRIVVVVEASAAADVGARLLGDNEVQLSAPAETAFDVPTGVGPGEEIAATFFDLARPLLELFDPLDVETTVGALVDAVEKLVRHLHTVGRVELQRGLDDPFRSSGHDVFSLPRFRAAGPRRLTRRCVRPRGHPQPEASRPPHHLEFGAVKPGILRTHWTDRPVVMACLAPRHPRP